MFILSERHLRRVLAEYVGYFNCWRPHRSIGQRAPRAPPRTIQSKVGGNIIAKPVLGGLHHIYDLLHDHPDGYFRPTVPEMKLAGGIRQIRADLMAAMRDLAEHDNQAADIKMEIDEICDELVRLREKYGPGII
jgi:hypothetical protein